MEANDITSTDRPIWAARPVNGGEVRIALQAPTDIRYAHLAWPKVVRLQNGSILLACIAGEFHGTHGGGCPAVACSMDDGQSFGGLRILREFGNGHEYTHAGNMALGVAPDGTVVLLVMAFDGDRTNHIFGWYSEDNGVNWKPADTSALGPNKTGSVYGRVLAQPGGELLVTGHYRKGSSPYEQGIWFSRSVDGGHSWLSPTRIHDGLYVEPCLVRTNSGRLLGLLRNNQKTADNGYGAEAAVYSDDGGHSWTATPPLLLANHPETHGLASPFVMNDPMDPEKVIALTTERAASGKVPGSIELWRASVSELNFVHCGRILEFPHIPGDSHIDFGYPWLVPTEKGSLRMFYYHGQIRGLSHIWTYEMPQL